MRVFNASIVERKAVQKIDNNQFGFRRLDHSQVVGEPVWFVLMLKRAHAFWLNQSNLP